NNGRPLLPDAAPPAGVELATLADLARSAPARLEAVLGRVAPLAHGFAALNTALFEDGLAIFVKAGAVVGRPIEVREVGVAGDRPTLSYPRLLVVADSGSALSLVASFGTRGETAALVSSVTEVRLEPDASVEHVRVVHGMPTAHHVGLLAARVGARARY